MSDITVAIVYRSRQNQRKWKGFCLPHGISVQGKNHEVVKERLINLIQEKPYLKARDLNDEDIGVLKSFSLLVLKYDPNNSTLLTQIG